ncbi:hypothetical protein BABINDRAFT_167866 [Babjeviella inositovora NRRL Y-12698]|uniref:Uncharacterized protein n=1 Tax=Babjeviella inositovora NRRL Y-12698 TaxID=984486 RepID=A0A1E3QM20_9ASCO|nr:uncharacterized protein BABINDRAFT_167866 [Babjeviella inositovora NRRL Y-12698]ODQ78668.1 hypothetical protein BABINDRAFT_167866 [Babjeviella inositovora NRRL Y-12698]
MAPNSQRRPESLSAMKGLTAPWFLTDRGSERRSKTSRFTATDLIANPVLILGSFGKVGQADATSMPAPKTAKPGKPKTLDLENAIPTHDEEASDGSETTGSTNIQVDVHRKITETTTLPSGPLLTPERSPGSHRLLNRTDLTISPSTRTSIMLDDDFPTSSSRISKSRTYHGRRTIKLGGQTTTLSDDEFTAPVNIVQDGLSTIPYEELTSLKKPNHRLHPFEIASAMPKQEKATRKDIPEVSLKRSRKERVNPGGVTSKGNSQGPTEKQNKRPTKSPKYHPGLLTSVEQKLGDSPAAKASDVWDLVEEVTREVTQSPKTRKVFDTTRNVLIKVPRHGIEADTFAQSVARKLDFSSYTSGRVSPKPESGRKLGSVPDGPDRDTLSNFSPFVEKSDTKTYKAMRSFRYAPDDEPGTYVSDEASDSETSQEPTASPLKPPNNIHDLRAAAKSKVHSDILYTFESFEGNSLSQHHSAMLETTLRLFDVSFADEFKTMGGFPEHVLERIWSSGDFVLQLLLLLSWVVLCNNSAALGVPQDAVDAQIVSHPCQTAQVISSLLEVDQSLNVHMKTVGVSKICEIAFAELYAKLQRVTDERYKKIPDVSSEKLISPSYFAFQLIMCVINIAGSGETMVAQNALRTLQSIHYSVLEIFNRLYGANPALSSQEEYINTTLALLSVKHTLPHVLSDEGLQAFAHNIAAFVESISPEEVFACKTAHDPRVSALNEALQLLILLDKRAVFSPALVEQVVTLAVHFAVPSGLENSETPLYALGLLVKNIASPLVLPELKYKKNLGPLVEAILSWWLRIEEDDSLTGHCYGYLCYVVGRVMTSENPRLARNQMAKLRGIRKELEKGLQIFRTMSPEFEMQVLAFFEKMKSVS